MTAAAPPALAISASNCTGTAAFRLALRDHGGMLHCGTAAPGTDLAGLARQLCAGAGVAAADLRELRVDRGPGSYTGLRVAVTFARTLHAFGGARLLACTSFELLALAALQAGAPAGAVLRPVLDGRRDRLLTAALALRQDHLVFAAPPRALAAAGLREAIGAGEHLLAATPLRQQLAQLLGDRQVALLPAAEVGAELLFDARLSLLETVPADLEPLYLLASYAG